MAAKQFPVSSSTLKALIKANVVEPHSHTLTKVKTLNGGTVTAMYVDKFADIDGREPYQVTWRGRKFVLKYNSGSFFPYVYEVFDHYVEMRNGIRTKVMY